MSEPGTPGASSRLRGARVDSGQVPERSGVLVTGTHRVVARVPITAPVSDYQNDGYKVTVLPVSTEDPVSGTREIVVTVFLDQGRSGTKFQVEKARTSGPQQNTHSAAVARLASSLVHGVTSLEDAVTAVLTWTARNIEYRLDRFSKQDAESVLLRRTAYCSGLAALSVALLRTLGIEAREVVGYSLAATGGGPAGYHRWIEVFYPDRGWRFADPKSSIGFVEATYVRLADTLVPAEAAGQWLILSEERSLRPVASAGALPIGVEGKYQGQPVLGASLRVYLEDNAPAGLRFEVELAGGGWVRRKRVDRGYVDFVDLAPGDYRVLAIDNRRRPQSGGAVTIDSVGLVDLNLRPESKDLH